MPKYALATCTLLNHANKATELNEGERQTDTARERETQRERETERDNRQGEKSQRKTDQFPDLRELDQTSQLVQNI